MSRKTSKVHLSPNMSNAQLIGQGERRTWILLAINEVYLIYITVLLRFCLHAFD